MADGTTDGGGRVTVSTRGMPPTPGKKRDLLPCPGAVDYGHHGRERCVWCGEPAPTQESTDA